MLKVSFFGFKVKQMGFCMRNMVAGVLANGADEFEDGDEVYEAVGEVLQEISTEKTEAEIK